MRNGLIAANAQLIDSVEIANESNKLPEYDADRVVQQHKADRDGNCGAHADRKLPAPAKLQGHSQPREEE